MLRIALVSSKYPPAMGGAEIACQALARGMAERGHRVDVVTQVVDGLPPLETDPSGARVHRVVQPVAVGPLWGMSYMLHVRAALRRLGPFDAIHCRQTYLHTVVACQEARRTGAGCVTTIASSGELHDLARLERHRFGVRLARRATAWPVVVHCLSRRSAAESARWIRAGESARVLPNFIDLGRFAPRDAGRPPRAVFVGRLVEVKNVAGLLRALAEAGSGMLDLAGDGPQREELGGLAASLGIAERVRFLGRRSDVPEVLRSAGFAASASCVEGLSNALLEQLAAGLGVLMFDVGGVRDALDPEDTGGSPLLPGATRLPAGIVVEPGNAHAFAEALRRLFQDAPLREELGRSARSIAEAHFDRSVLLGRYEELYREATAITRAGARA